MTINARSEMDLDEDTVLEKVSKASGTSSCQKMCISLCTVLQILCATCVRSERNHLPCVCTLCVCVCVCVCARAQVLTSVFIRRRLAPCPRLDLW